MKLVIQIPCYNEENTLPITLGDLPKEVKGVDEVEWLVIDDGSTDNTEKVAYENGANHVIKLPQNLGLANAFKVGLESCLSIGADIIVNTDADNQYSAADIPKLIEPILNNEADFVIGSRPISNINEFSFIKKLLQKVGSAVVRSISGTPTVDAPSGFRALSRAAAIRLNVFSNYTYTLETIIQAGQNGISIKSVPVNVNRQTRESRLVRSVPSYIKRSILTMLRIFVVYRPLRFFAVISAFVFCIGFLISCRFLYYYIIGEGSGMVQSLILSSTLMGSAILLFMVALLADLVAVNRKLLEKLQCKLYELDEKVAELQKRR